MHLEVEVGTVINIHPVKKGRNSATFHTYFWMQKLLFSGLLRSLSPKQPQSVTLCSQNYVRIFFDVVCPGRGVDASVQT